ncbi:cytochrome-c oxidase [Alsobacter soli]|uniref:Cytochrome-c oxidase n=1 Tax=Alsobacter soli TaxID=2109933 RepID=A0A2T1HYT2_9HYPH|nr:cytochrome-c oxidase [Alsobacter soli]PSC06775.1 cytochrome-c oxidase [Alsobacter soli]
MAKIDTLFISFALLYAIVGVGLGIGMGVAQNFAYAHLHAHINLLGWATMALYGLVHRSWPELRRSKLATVQFWLAMTGLPVFLVGLPFAQFYEKPAGAIIGSLMVFSGIICFFVLFARHAWSRAALPTGDMAARVQPRGA